MYKILNQSGESTEILLYSLIEGGVTASQLVKTLQASPSDNITLRINSDGGEVFDAIAIYNYLKDKHATVIIDGMCASSASIVAMAGERIIMKRGTMFMIHNPVTVAIGESEDLKNAAEMLEKVTLLIEDIYQKRTGLPHEELVGMMTAQTWLTPEEALGYGFCDEIDALRELPVPAPNDRIYKDAADAVRAVQRGEGLYSLEAAPKNDPLCAYNHGIQEERERFRALDELYTPERASIINRAKYKTGETAQEIALELLKAEAPQTRETVNNFKTTDPHAQVIDAMAEYINRRRG